MAFYQFTRNQIVNANLEEVWRFISSPANLKIITPDFMGFDILSDVGSGMYPGMIIEYRVRPVPFINTRWVTEISHVEKNKFFVDEQRVGPYKLWHHQHLIRETEDGILMTDVVSYVPPFGILGAIANKLFIRHKLKQIFDYRKNAIEQLYPASNLK